MANFGDIFLGVTPAGMRSYLKDVFANCRGKYSRLILPCAGRFADGEVAVQAGWNPGDIEMSDIGLFSSVLGYSVTGQPLADLGVKFHDELEHFGRFTGTDKEAGAILVALKICQLKTSTYFEKRVRDELLRSTETYVDQLQGKVDALKVKLNGISYAIRDVTEHARANVDHPETLLYVSPPEYCLAPNERILTADLRWVPCGELKVGDEILAFDEQVPEGRKLRRWRWATILRSEPAMKECVRVHLENGDSVICTVDHPWLADRYTYDAGRPKEWVRAEQLMLDPYGHRQERKGQCVLKALPTWSRADTFEAGWLSGMYDGEGFISLAGEGGSSGAKLGVAQKRGPVLERIEDVLRKHGFIPATYDQAGDVRSVYIAGGVPEILRALGTFAPHRLLANLRNHDIGRQSVCAPTGTTMKVQVVGVEPLGIREIQSITTSTSTYIGEGYLMHNTGGYTKMFDTKGLVTWNEPNIPEFDPTAKEDLYRLLLDGKALSLIYRCQTLTPTLEGKAVFANQAGKRLDFVATNRPEELELFVKLRPETQIAPVKIPLLPLDYEITEKSKIGIIETKREHALYYRELFAHKLGVTRSESYFLMLVDGYIFGVFGMFFDKVGRGQSGTVHETFGFNVPSTRYPRLNRLLMSVLVSEQTRQYFQARIPTALREIDAFQTTCIATTPEVKANRGLLKIVERYQRPDGRYHINYYAKFKPWTWSDALADWLQRMREQQRQTGRDLGVRH